MSHLTEINENNQIQQSIQLYPIQLQNGVIVACQLLNPNFFGGKGIQLRLNATTQAQLVFMIKVMKVRTLAKQNTVMSTQKASKLQAISKFVSKCGLIHTKSQIILPFLNNYLQISPKITPHDISYPYNTLIKYIIQQISLSTQQNVALRLHRCKLSQYLSVSSLLLIQFAFQFQNLKMRVCQLRFCIDEKLHGICLLTFSQDS
eukprot:TRINITY_DN10083_c0_g1_i8.p1 TRINITY_DN10083_c0_g1~~TRINITY_DN10083_c0_g1_i8.p1  ORF type:complete len:204 (+),score=-21.91 TRINITY_DN10083_c0_g1_i8:347-958(+)